MKYDDWLTEPGAPLRADARSLEASLETNATRWDLTTHAHELAGHTVLLLDDDKNPDHAAVVAALGKAGAKHLTTYIWPTDHTFSDRRIALARTVLRWLRGSCGY
jgi:hypothetical protein